MKLSKSKLWMGGIAELNERAGQFFWAKTTRRFFKDSPSHWVPYDAGERTFIRRKRDSQWREVFEFGARIGSPISGAEGLSSREFGAFLALYPLVSVSE